MLERLTQNLELDINKNKTQVDNGRQENISSLPENSVQTENEIDSETVLDEEIDVETENEKEVENQENSGILIDKVKLVTKDLIDKKPLYSPNINNWINLGGVITVNSDNIWEYKTADGISIKYKNGYPDFKEAGFVIQEVEIGEFSNTRYQDFKLADKIASTPKRPTSTWHHHEDGKTLQEVERIVHEQFRHKGGFSLKKETKND